MLRNLYFRTIKTKDSKRVLEIYNYYINNDLSNFEEKPLSYNNFINLKKKILNLNLPFIVCEKNKYLVGFAFLNNFRNKSGYKYSFENSIYVDHKYLGQNIGYNLLKKLVNNASKKSNIKTIIAVIEEKNSKASIIIHEKNGFKRIGTLKKVGFKKKQWLNIILMQKIFNEKN